MPPARHRGQSPPGDSPYQPHPRDNQGQSLQGAVPGGRGPTPPNVTDLHQSCAEFAESGFGPTLQPYAQGMPRSARRASPTGVYHVNGRALPDQWLFADDLDRQLFLGGLDRAAGQHAWSLYAYCLVGTHYHLLVGASLEALSGGIHRLHTRYVASVNRHRGRVGPLFRGRFHSTPVEREAHMIESMRYVVLNPVRAGLARRAADWRWSSYRAHAGLDARPRFLAPLQSLPVDLGADPEATFRAFVAEREPGGARMP